MLRSFIYRNLDRSFFFLEIETKNYFSEQEANENSKKKSLVWSKTKVMHYDISRPSFGFTANARQQQTASWTKKLNTKTD